jgi:AAA domain, putative AbiEii toxin, Type IV TA system/AAA ATPase domain
MTAFDAERLAPLVSLSVQGFRCFTGLEVRPLETINVIVGRNNAGKTCLLEAIEVLLDGEPSALARIAMRREEVEVEDENKFSSPVVRPAVHYAFHQGAAREAHDRGWVVSSSRPFEIAGEVASYDESQPLHRSFVKATVTLGEEFRGALQWENWRGEKKYPFDLVDAKSTPFAQRGALFVGSERPSGASSANLWGQLSGSNAEDGVIEALRIIEPRVKRIGLGYQPPGVFLGLDDDDARYPLGHFGEGVGRLFSLAAYLALSAGRTLLIDDIDTGLHVSTMKKMWELVFTAARKFDLQLFATTHSDDCLRGLAAALAEHPEFHSMVALHRLDLGSPTTTHYDAEEIIRSADANLEVRG